MGHGHGHHHHEPARNYGRAFLVGFVLNAVFIVVEVAFGLVAHSMALLADAGHNVTDVLGLGLAWWAAALSRRKPSARRTYGYRRMSILAALANAVLLLAATGAIAWESIRRLGSPGEVQGNTMIAVAAVGVLVNGLAAFLLRGTNDLNVRSAFLHLAADAAISLGVVVTGVVINATQWTILDPLVGIALALVIVASTWSVLRHSLDLALDAVPRDIDPEKVRAFLAALPGVREVHDLHIWGLSTTENALTVHLVMPTGASEPRFLTDVSRELHDRFAIEHATLQVECAEAPDPCRLAPDEVV